MDRTARFRVDDPHRLKQFPPVALTGLREWMIILPPGTQDLCPAHGTGCSEVAYTIARGKNLRTCRLFIVPAGDRARSRVLDRAPSPPRPLHPPNRESAARRAPHPRPKQGRPPRVAA